MTLTFSCSKKEDKILPKKQDLTESVYTSVIIQPDSLYQVYAAVAGILENNLVWFSSCRLSLFCVLPS